ncbi:hypothetical protein [Spirosoma aerophilum]
MFILNQKTFDLTFDKTFQKLIGTDYPVTAPTCRVPGVLLGWESPRGWAYYLFRGNTDTDFDAQSSGEFEQAGAIKDTRRVGRDVLTVRAGGLTQPDSDVIKTIFLSTRVYVIAPDKSGIVRSVPVHVATGTYAVWRESANRIGIEFQIRFPSTKSFRA